MLGKGIPHISVSHPGQGQTVCRDLVWWSPEEQLQGKHFRVKMLSFTFSLKQTNPDLSLTEKSKLPIYLQGLFLNH